MSEATRRFLEILRGQQQAATMPQANIMRQYQTPQGIVPPMALRRPTPPSAMPTVPKLSPMMQEIAKRAAARRSMTSGAGAGMPTGAMPQSSAPTMPQGGGAPAAATFGQRFAQPQTQALLGAAIAGADASGYQDRPVSLGQVLGRMGAGAMSGYQAAEDRIAAQKAAAQKSVIDRLLAEAQFAKATRPETTSLMRNLALAGIDPNSPEGKKIVMDALTKPGTTVDFGKQETQFAAEAAKAAFRRTDAVDKEISTMRTVENELSVIEKLLAGGAETGRIQNALVPIKQLLKEVNLLSDEEAERLGTAELLQRSIARIIPNMRVAGSGSTSDREMEMFQLAAPTFSRTAEGNRKIAKGMMQAIEFAKERRNLMDVYLQKNKNLLGFDEFANEKQGKVFETFDKNDPNALDAYQQAYEDGKIKVGDLVYNGINFVYVTKESVQ